MAAASTDIRNFAQQMFAPPATATAAGTDTKNPWATYWPQPQAPIAHPYHQAGGVPQSTWGITKAMIGRSLQLEQLFITKVLTANDFIFTFMPMVNNPEMTIRYSRTIFTPTIMPVVPQRGHVRVLQSLTREGQGTMVRHALGLLLSQDFMQTDRGLREFFGQTSAITRSITETMLHESLMEMLAVGINPARIEREAGSYDFAAWERFSEWAVGNWAVFQKQEFPLQQVDTDIENLKIRGGAPMDVRYGYIVDKELLRFLAYVPTENTIYYLRGPGARESVDAGPAGLVALRGKPIHFLQHFDTDGILGTDNALRLNRQIGEMVPFLDDERGGNYTDYTSAARSRVVYSEDLDTLVRISLRDMLMNSGRFDAATGRFRDINSAELIENSSDGFGNELADPFHYRREGDSELRPIDYLGNMYPGRSDTDPGAHILARDFVDAAKSITTGLGNPHAKARWDNMVDVVKQIRNVDMSSDAALAFKAAVNTANPGSFSHATSHKQGLLPSSDVTEVAPNIYGFVDLPTSGADAWAGAFSLPPGFQSYPGMRTIAEAWRSNGSNAEAFVSRYGFSAKWAERTSQAVDFIDELVSKLQVVAPGARFLDPAYVSPWFTDPNAATAFVENLVTGKGHPMFLMGGGGEGNANPLQARISNQISADAAGKITPEAISALTNFGSQYRGDGTFATDYNTVAATAATAFPVTGDDAGARSALSRQLRAVGRSRLLEVLANLGVSSLRNEGARTDLKTLVFNKAAEQFGMSNMGGAGDLGAAISTLEFVKAMGNMSDGEFWAKLSDYAPVIVKHVKDNRKYFVFGSVKAATAAEVEANMKEAVRSLVAQYKAQERDAENLVLNSQEFAGDVAARSGKLTDLDGQLAAAIKDGKARRSPLIYTPRDYLSIWKNAAKAVGTAWPSSARNAEQLASAGEMEELYDLLGSTNMDKEVGALENIPTPLRVSSLIGARVQDTAVFDNVSKVNQAVEGSDYSYFSRMNNELVGATLGDYYGGDVNTTELDYHKRNISGSFPGVDTAIPASMGGNFAELFKRISEECSNDLLRAVAQAYLSLPATLPAILAGVQHNVAHMFNYMFARPHAEYQTATLIQMAMDGEAGNNYFAYPHVYYGTDPHQGLLFAQVAFWNRPIIHEFRGVFLLHDSMVVDYIGGLGTAFLDETQYSPLENVYGNDDSRQRNSAMSIMLPRNFVPSRKISLTGSYDLLGVPEAHTRAHYPSYQFETRRWKWDRFHDSFMSDIPVDDPRRLSSPNLVLFTGPYWHPDGKMELGNGHFNANYTYPGAKSARVGGRKAFEKGRWRGAAAVSLAQ